MQLVFKALAVIVWIGGLVAINNLDFTYIKWQWWIVGATALAIIRPPKIDKINAVIWVAISILMLVAMRNGLGSLTDQYIWSYLAVSVLSYVTKPADLLDRDGVPGILSIGMIAVAGYGLLQFAGILLPNLDGYREFDYGSFFGLSNFAIEVVAVGISVTIADWISGPKETRTRTYSGIAVVLGLIYLIVAGSRAGYFALALGASMGLFHSNWRPELVRPVSILAAIAALLVAGFSIVSPRASDQFRLESVTQAVHLVSEHPMGLGLGWYADASQVSSVATVIERQGRTGHLYLDPHNEFLRIVAEFGIPLTLAFLGLAIWAFRIVSPLTPAALAGCGALVGIMLVGFPLRSASGTLALAICAVLIFTKDDKIGVEPSRAVPRLGIWAIAAMLLVVSLASWRPLAKMSEAETFVRKGQDYAARQLPALALRSYQSAVSLAPWSRLYVRSYARLLEIAKQWDLADYNYQKLLDAPFVSDNLLVRSIAAKGFTTDRKGVSDQYYKWRARYQKMNKEDGRAVVAVLHYVGALPEAVELADVHRLQDEPTGRMMVAQILMDANQYALAEKVLAEGVALPDASMGMRLAHIVAVEYTENLDEAARLLDEFEAMYPDFIDIDLYRARIAWRRGEMDKTYDLVVKTAQRRGKWEVNPSNEGEPVFREIYEFVVDRNRHKALPGK